MGRTARWGVAGVLVLAACSGGGGTAATTTTSSSVTTTTRPTTTTTTPEQAVKDAYLAYWAMIDRLAAAPDAADIEISKRTAEPLLTTVRDNLATQAQQGRVFTTPPGHKNLHAIKSVTVSGDSASITECFIDGRVVMDATGNVVDDQVVSKLGQAALLHVDSTWLVTEVVFTQRTPGDSGCAA